MNKNPITLSELLSTVKEIIRQNFPHFYWIIAEIAEAKENQKGHFYITLVEKDDDKVLAQIRANIWAYEYRKLINKFKSATGEGFKVGMKVMLLISIEFHEVYGVSLVIKDVEPSYTLGEMALKKKAILDRLKKEGLIDLNKALSLPPVPQRIAIISSPQAAGLEDFIDQIRNNQYGYYFKYELFPSLMQGAEVEATIIEKFDQILARSEDFDLVVIIRGGGSSVDLSCFDNYEIAKKIANFPLPVITGIGHEKDDTVVDIVAHTRLKTPTAVAEFLISGLRAFEEEILDIFQTIRDLTLKYVNDQNNKLKNLCNKLIYSSKNYTTNALNILQLTEMRLSKSWKYLIDTHSTRLERLEQAIRHLSPENILKRGYSITYLNGKALKSTTTIKDGEIIETRLIDGSFKSVVKNKVGGNKKVATRQDNLFSGIE
ncbi:MAG: exodeoxyribonuclease VII large subunit [Thermodesulfovibrionales bacterium]|nr:exodeoxyribonuclease VII large subunit [Thermodesulfovibrionales bacterium]